MFEHDGKVYRNLQEQVLKNMKDIADLKVSELSSRLGFKLLTEEPYVSAELLPRQYKGNYGDALLVGPSAPYNLYVWMREDNGQGGAWVDWGKMETPTVLRGPEGQQGKQGEQGVRGSIWTSSGSDPKFEQRFNDGDQALNTSTGDVYQFSGGVWSKTGNITGPTGKAAGFGSVTATVKTISAQDAPTVKVTQSGDDTQKNFKFDFELPAPMPPEVSADATVDQSIGVPEVEVVEGGNIEHRTFTFNFKNIKGETGEQGIKGEIGLTPDVEVTAEVDSNIGTPEVEVTKGGTTENPTFNFSFKNIKGETGQRGQQGAEGPMGDPFKILGTVESYSSLPDANSTPSNAGYLVRKDNSALYELYYIEGEAPDARWTNSGTAFGGLTDCYLYKVTMWTEGIRFVAGDTEEYLPDLAISDNIQDGPGIYMTFQFISGYKTENTNYSDKNGDDVDSIVGHVIDYNGIYNSNASIPVIGYYREQQSEGIEEDFEKIEQIYIGLSGNSSIWGGVVSSLIVLGRRPINLLQEYANGGNYHARIDRSVYPLNRMP